MADDAVLVERRGRTMLITLNRPEARNAVNAPVALGLGAALEEAETDPDVWAVVLTGRGSAFCAGADLKALMEQGEAGIMPPGTEQWGFAGLVNHPISKPMIAAVNGFALGGGTEIALACDLVVAADTATFGLPEVKRGIIAAAGGLIRLPGHLPRKVAMGLILTGDPIDAATARDLGLVNDVVPADQVVAAALALAERICANAPLAVQASKRIALGLVNGTFPSEEAAWARNFEEADAIRQTEDCLEGVMAFATKRAPEWKAR